MSIQSSKSQKSPSRGLPYPTYYDLVYAVVRQIPRGRVTNYGAIADYLALGASRMVGWALNNSHHMDRVPAHRVVNRKGELSGRHHFATPTLMQELLQAEGVEVENDCVVNFREIFWHPSELGDDWEPFDK
jgi:methylated-DNA-protein-cysteine methyltransferase-like protein